VVANLALLGGSLVVALGATELVLRLAPGLLSEEARLRLSWQEQKLSHAARTRPDSSIGFLYGPGGHDQVRRGDVHFSYTTDGGGFRNAGRAGGGPLYFEVDGHANAAGNRVIAQAVQSYLRARQTELGLRLGR
jgi:hypothetical protein